MFERIHKKEEMEEEEGKKQMRGHQEKIVRRVTGTAAERKEA
jgi:hypothetical protein